MIQKQKHNNTCFLTFCLYTFLYMKSTLALPPTKNTLYNFFQYRRETLTFFKNTYIRIGESASRCATGVSSVILQQDGPGFEDLTDTFLC